MSKYLPYNPEQGYLLPPNVREVLGAGHICFFVHQVVERLDLRAIDATYGEEGREAYAPQLMLKLWVYAYLLGLTSTRRLEQRVREDLGFRYLAGGAGPDHWTLNEFRKRHGVAINDAAVQVVEMARQLGLARLGQVAIDSTRVKASAARDRIDHEQRLRDRRAKIRRDIRRWQKQMGEESPDENGGGVAPAAVEKLEQELATIPARLERLRKSGQRKLSRTDPEARHLRERGGRFVLGYTAEIAVSEDHIIVAHRVTQNTNDNAALVPMVERVERNCRAAPQRVLADSGYFSHQNLVALRERHIDAYVPDSNLAAELNTGRAAPPGIGRQVSRDPDWLRMRKKMRTRQGRRIYQKRKAIVEPVFGVMKEQRNMRSFRRRGLENVNVEFSLAVLAYNLGRIFQLIG